MKINDIQTVTRAYPHIDEVQELYESSFPKNEQAPFSTLLKNTRRSNVDFSAYFADNTLVGMSYIVHEGTLSYLFYLAVPEALRGQGFGSEILQILKNTYPNHRIFLSMEEFREDAPNYEIRLRRKGFYERNGFPLIGMRVREGSEIFELAGTSPDVPAKEYLKLMNKYLGIMRFYVRPRVLDEKRGR